MKSYSNKLYKAQDQDIESTEHHPLPKLRRVIEITDYDSGQPCRNRIELYRTNRIDCYDVVIDSELWKKKIGWSRVLASI